MSLSSITAESPQHATNRRLPLRHVNAAALCVLLLALVLLLWPHWRANPDLSHGFAAPLVFLLLVHEARSGSSRYLAAGPRHAALQTAFLALGVLTLGTSGLYAASLEWSHALVAFTLTLAVTFLLAGAAVGFASSAVRWIPFNWPLCAAVALWPLCAPVPPGTYTRLTMGLQLTITENVLRALHLLGIPAQRHGNIIELATTSVGVEEACSGVRSLVSCLFAGLLFSATLVRRPWARALLIALSGPIALAMNFIRSLTLTLLANAGTDISGRWHDVTGYAVLGLTAAVLAMLAVLLERHGQRVEARLRHRAQPGLTPTAAPADDGASRAWSLQRPLAASLTLAIVLVVFFAANTRPSVRRDAPVPDLMAILPAESPGWQVRTSHDLYQFSSTLQTEHLAQRTYTRATSDGPQQITLYLAYWRAGQAPVSLVASHTPDACWPGAGWVPIKDRTETDPVLLPDRPLTPPESRHFRSGGFPQYVWFWHLHDGRPIAYRDPYSARELLAIAWRYGFTRNGDQLFVRVSSNQPWNKLADEPLIAAFFSRLQPLGL